MKYLLDRNGKKGLFFFPDNDAKFVIGNITEFNGIGKSVQNWSSGSYYRSLNEAYKDFVKVEVR